MLPGSYFAHDVLLVNKRLRDTADAIAMTFVQVQLLAADDLLDALAVFPTVSVAFVVGSVASLTRVLFPLTSHNAPWMPLCRLPWTLSILS